MQGFLLVQPMPKCQKERPKGPRRLEEWVFSELGHDGQPWCSFVLFDVSGGAYSEFQLSIEYVSRESDIVSTKMGFPHESSLRAPGPLRQSRALVSSFLAGPKQTV